MSAPAAERGRQVRTRLLRAAVELIGELGWSAVSTRVLAERAGVTPSVVHYHFPSMQALLREAAVGAMQHALDDTEAVLGTPTAATDLVNNMLASVDQYTGADPTSRVFVEAYLASARDNLLRDDIAHAVTLLRERFARRLAATGVSSADDTAAVLVAALDGLMLHRGLGAGPAAGDAAAILYRLVSPEAPRSSPPVPPKSANSAFRAGQGAERRRRKGPE